MIRRIAACLAVLLLISSQHSANAQIRITEYMYQGLGDNGFGEFFELTNVGLIPIDLTGWSYDDDSQTAGSTDLSALGTLSAGESAIVSEASAADFRTNWGLPLSVKVLGDLSNNLGRNDEINIYDASNVLADRLDFGDQDFSGSIRTQGRSGNPTSSAALGADDPYQWALSNALGDDYGSYFSSLGEQGNPGSYGIPEPASLGLGVFSLLATLSYRRRS